LRKVSLIYFFFYLSHNAHAAQKNWFEFSAGPGVYLGSDDNQRYGLAVNSNIAEFFGVRYFSQGTRFENTKQEKYLLSALALLPNKLFGTSEIFYTPIGVSFLWEYTSVGKNKFLNRSLGLAVGIGTEIFKNSRFYVNTEWLVHIFSSGISTLYLATSRKQSLTVGIGFRI
jgi:hypothetical protein